MSFLRVLLLAGLVITAACQSTGRSGPQLATLPADTEIVEPGSDVPAKYAAFSGTWAGKWGGRLDSKVAVRTVDPEGNVSAVYAWGDHPAGKFSAGSLSKSGQIDNGVLTLVLNSRAGIVASFEMINDDQLQGTWSRGGQPSKAIFSRVD